MNIMPFLRCRNGFIFEGQGLVKTSPFYFNFRFLFLALLLQSSVVFSDNSANVSPLVQQCVFLFKHSFSQVFPMNPRYKGENQGLYYDKNMKFFWNVHYFSKQELLPYRVFLKDQFFVNHLGKKMESEFDPEAMSFAESLLVITKNYDLLVLPFNEIGRYHHSSLAAGKDVLFAGTISFSHGQLRYLTDMSGHYQPNLQGLKDAVLFFESLGIRMNDLKISGHGVREISNSYSLTFKEWKEALSKINERQIQNEKM